MSPPEKSMKWEDAPFLPSPTNDGYSRVPLDNLTTRLSIRSLNKTIEYHSQERSKTRLTRNMLSYLIERIPDQERAMYARHCLPFAVLHRNPVALWHMLDRGLRAEKTWALFLALWQGDEVLARDLINHRQKILDQEDVNPLLLASYHGHLSLGQLFQQDDLVDLTPINIIQPETMIPLIQEQVRWTQKELIRFWEKDSRRVHGREERLPDGRLIVSKTCTCPRATLMEIEKTISVLLRMSKQGRREYPRDIERSSSLTIRQDWSTDWARPNAGLILPTEGYAISWLDSLAQIVRAYGILRWGYLEHGGHQIIEFFRPEPSNPPPRVGLRVSSSASSWPCKHSKLLQR